MKEPRPIYSNDRTAPRMRKAQFVTHMITKELWKKFTKDNLEYKDMPWSDFSKKWNEIAETIREEAVVNPLGVKLGSYTGELKTQWLSNKLDTIDYTTSTEIGEKVRHTNLVAKGKVGKIKWERRWAVKFNKMLQFFAFEETRDINDRAKEHIAQHPEKLRVARSTLGGHSIWRQLGKKDG